MSLPSVGKEAGLLDSLSLVCSVLKLVSSLAFCSTLGGLCFLLYSRYSSSFFCTATRELPLWRDSSQGSVRRIPSSRSLASRSYSSISLSLSWLTFSTLQMRLAAISAFRIQHSGNVKIFLCDVKGQIEIF